MYLGDGGHASHRLGERIPRLGIGGSAGLQSQQRRHGLQVVLHPMVDFADRRILGQQGAVASLDLGDVADQYPRAGRCAADHQRQGTQQHGRTTRVDLEAHAGTAGQCGADVVGEFAGLEHIGDQWPGDRHQVVALQLGGQAHPVIGRHCVGAGVVHHSGDVEADEAVADAGTRPRHGKVADVGEGALGHHVHQVLGAIQIGLLQSG